MCHNGMLIEEVQEDIFGTIAKNFNSIENHTATGIKESILQKGFEAFIIGVHCPDEELFYWQTMYKDLMMNYSPRIILQQVINNLKNEDLRRIIGVQTNQALYEELSRMANLKVEMIEALLVHSRRQVTAKRNITDTAFSMCINQDNCHGYLEAFRDEGEIIETIL